MTEEHRPTTVGANVTCVAHPPERGRRTDPVLLPCACCCCCCCCLHTIGGVIGAVAGSTVPMKHIPKQEDDDFPFPFRRDVFDDEWTVHPTLLYWLLVLTSLIVTSGVYFVRQGARREEDLFVGFLVGLFILPALQLAASIVTAVLIGICYEDRYNAFRRLGRITAFSIAGSVIGVLAMIGICGVGSLFG